MSVQDEYNSPCPGLGKRVKGHRHSNRCNRLIVVSRRRPWNPQSMAQIIWLMAQQRAQQAGETPETFARSTKSLHKSDK